MEMHRQHSIKIAILIVIVIASMAVMGVLLANRQSDLSLESYDDEMEQEFGELDGLLETAQDNADTNTAQFDAVYQSKAASVAFIANNTDDFEATHAKMVEYQDLLDVDNVLIVRADGEILAQAQPTKADFASSRFNLLRTTFDTGEPSEAVEIEVPTEDWLMRYYAAAIDDDTMVVIEQDPAELRALIQESGSTESVLNNIAIGQYGYMFAVSAQDYIVEYHPDSLLIGTDALDDGIDVADLEDGNFAWMTIDGESYYCGVSKIDNMYYIAAVPESDMAASRNITVGVILFVFFAVMVIVVFYGIVVMHEDEKRDPALDFDEADATEEELTRNIENDLGKDFEFNPETGELTRKPPTGIKYNKRIGRKAAVLSFVGFLAILVVSFYMQTLFALSSKSVSNNERVEEVVATIERADAQADELTEQYRDRYLSKTQVAGYILDLNPDLENREDLQALADTLQVDQIYVFDDEGVLIASNAAYAHFELSEDPEDQSYEFRQLLQGAESVIQDPQANEVSGILWQYIGVPLHDSETGMVNGIIQIGIRPTLLEDLLATVQIDSVLQSVKSGDEGFAFAVNREDDTFAYFPANTRLEGESVFDYGMEEKELKDGYCDYITIAGTTYYASSAESGDYYIYLAGTEGELMSQRLPLTVIVGAIALVCIVVLFLLESFEYYSKKKLPETEAAEEAEEEAEEEGPTDTGVNDRIIDVVMPSGRTTKTESVASRWLNRSFKWDEMTAWQKTIRVMRWLIGLMVLVICIAVLFKDSLFDSSSIFSYILGDQWEYGFNIFAITACIMFICVAATVVTLVQMLLRLLSSVLNARGETICRMLSSFVKYGTAIAMIYYSLYLIGVDMTTLLVSAGILSIAISLGAQSLVSDIISGLFIIFEGEFRVGDIITIDEWRGTVVEIGIRTTKVEEPSQNVKVIRNSDVTNVINMTKKLSFVSCEVGIEYGESLERVEAILAKELPGVADRLPAIVQGPFYKGVVSLDNSCVIIRVTVTCAEKDRMQLGRDLNREIKLIFDRNDINIPFPQVTVNQPTEFKEATRYEKAQAQQFNEDQKNVVKELDVHDEIGGGGAGGGHK